MLTIDRIRQALNQRPPTLLDPGDRSPAAVAMLLREEAAEIEVLFIERAKHPADPWSGNLAFPGGRRDPIDADLQAAAERETREEIGVDLARARLLGRLDDISGAYLPVTISCFVYLVTGPPKFTLNHEVRRTLWFSLAELCNPSRHLPAKLSWQGREREVHGIRLDDRSPLLWGITYRLIIQFLDRLQLVDPALGQIRDD